MDTCYWFVVITHNSLISEIIEKVKIPWHIKNNITLWNAQVPTHIQGNNNTFSRTMFVILKYRYLRGSISFRKSVQKYCEYLIILQNRSIFHFIHYIDMYSNNSAILYASSSFCHLRWFFLFIIVKFRNSCTIETSDKNENKNLTKSVF